MKFKLLFILSVLTITSCENNENKNEKEPKIQEFKIDIESKEISNNNYKVKIKTNFPENSSFIIDVSRTYKRKNSSELYSGDHYSQFNSYVKNGEVNFNFTVDDSKWIENYNKYKNENREYDNTLTEIDFESIEDSLEISVLYTPMAEKNKEIKKIVGENGENLNGDGMEKNGSFNIFSKKIMIFNKFKY